MAESINRRLDTDDVALLIAECGSGKTKIGSTALYAHQQGKHPGGKTFNVVLCPSQITEKWVREIEETLPNTFAGVVTDPLELDRLYAAFERDNKTAYAVISKELARDGYMKRPAVRWSRRKRAFVCPDCGDVIMMELSEDGSKYRVKADQFFFQRETDKNHKCEKCKTPLWTALNPNRQSDWVKIGSYGFVYRYKAAEHLNGCKDPDALDQIQKAAADPGGSYPASGAYRRMALSTYIKQTLKGRLDGLILDELHQYSNKSGQGDAMAELVGAAKKIVGMTATLINGYSKGIFYLLFRMAPDLMLKDGREYRKPYDFNRDYGVTESVYELKQAEYNANRRASKVKKQERQLPGVSPLVYTRFLIESAAFLSFGDMGNELYRTCVHRGQLETVLEHQLIQMQATKVSHGKIYFCPRSHMQYVDVFEQYVDELVRCNKNPNSSITVNSLFVVDDAKQREKMAGEFYDALKREIALYAEKIDYLIQSSSQSPAIMNRWVLKVNELEAKKRNYEEIFQRDFESLGDEFSLLRLQAQELTVRARSLGKCA